MTRPFFTEDNVGKKGIMLGNQAIARGILESGAIVGSGYPGTPSSEILETLADIYPYFPHLKLEWSVNEKVGFEVAYAASMCNVRAAATMKHVGLNVASDAFMTACYSGTRGGLVVVSADDPNCNSSQNEQDNRFFGPHALVPVFEPSTAQEAKDLMKYAFDFSEHFHSPVLYRTTTRLNHGRGDVALGEINKIKDDAMFDWDRTRWVCLPSHSRVLRLKLLDRMKAITEFAEEFPFSSLKLSEEKINGKKYGFIAAGVPYALLMDALEFFGIQDKVSILKLGMVYPLPKQMIKKLFSHVDNLLIVEELEPFLENLVKALAYEAGISKDVDIHGKDFYPQNGEFSAELYLDILSKFMGLDYENSSIKDKNLTIPPRFPLLCPGCSHRSTFYALKQVEKKLKMKFVDSGDIGCYTLSVYKPLEGMDAQVCMGGSIGLANGFSKVQPKENPIIAILGDSTFFHSGIPALINAVYNENDMLVFILDNRSTSMTGFQDNPGTGVKITKEPGIRVVLEDLVKGCGVSPENIWVEDSNNISAMTVKIEQAVKAKGVRVFISRHMCSLLEINQQKIQGVTPAVIKVDTEKCNGCMTCINKFGCPALQFDKENKKAYIDQTLCRGCEVCIEVCPQDAIYMESPEQKK